MKYHNITIWGRGHTWLCGREITSNDAQEPCMCGAGIEIKLKECLTYCTIISAVPEYN